MGFSLEVTDKNEVKNMVKEQTAPSLEEKQAIDDSVQEKVREIMNINMDSFDEKHEMTTVFEDFGTDVMKQSATKNDILGKRMVDFSAEGGESGEIAKTLQNLSLQMKGLDPSDVDFTKDSGVLGKLFNPVKRYFERYKTADQEISGIVKQLDKGKTTLKSDNVTLEIEQSNMRDLTKKLSKNIELGTQLDQYLSNAIDNAKAAGGQDEKVKFVEEEILFPLRQRIIDFQELLAVNQQSIVAMELIRRNNLELIRGVDRAKMVTVSALRAAVTVAGALYNQKIVLKGIQAVNEATNDMIGATAKMLKEQGADIQKQAVESTISVDTLKQAFNDTFAALDDINNYRAQALPQMAQTIQEFKTMAAEGEKRIQAMEKTK